jgi:hypothetical protein
MKVIILAGILTAGFLFSNCKNAKAEAPAAVETKQGMKIQVAILLDTSNSMDGLIEQAKSRLWNIVNTLTTLRFRGKTPEIEIALYEYGNNGIETDDYVRRVVALSTDLDLISQKIFALTTNGGSEYCGAAIDRAVKNLEWSAGEADIRLIYIAGNEPFTQGPVAYRAAAGRALEKRIFVHTIHCGDPEEGIRGMWREGAVAGKGKFFNINHDERIRYIETPYDDAISRCNARLNETYIGYGRTGAEKKMNQALQDRNAESVSRQYEAERAVSKSKKAYRNSSWDIVDLVKEDKNALEKMKASDLPEELRGKSKEEINTLLAAKEKERTAVQKEIEELAKQRQAYIDGEMKNVDAGADDLGRAINRSILEIALQKGYQVE